MSCPPDDDVIEVSLIGPGYGEGVVLHLGAGEWVVVDSCLDRTDAGRRGGSAALSYLQKIGIDPARRVKAIICTHWHNDHIGGLAELVGACDSADFFCPAALVQREFTAFAYLYAYPDPSPLTQATSEIIAVFEALRVQKRHPKFLVPDRIILRSTSGAALYSLSPSDKRVADFLARLAQQMPWEKPRRPEPRRRVGDLAPNAIAAALLLEIGSNDAALLGADLQETPGGGWTAILSESQVIGRRSSVFKIPHHGSETGECEGVWRNMLFSAPIALLTPFSRGGKPLPSEEDVSRILGRTDRAFTTARLHSVAPKRRDASVARTIRENGYHIWAAEPKLGQVRLRRSISATPGEWTEELLKNAVHLKHIRG